MPTIQNSSRSQVVQIWGKAYIRGTDGVWRPLAVGETVPQGTEILTEQNSIVMMTRGEVAVPQVAESPVERAIIAVDKGEDPPAAGLQGGGSGDMQPGLRVDRIAELVTPASIDTRLDATQVEFGIATRSDPGASPLGAPRLIAASSSIAAVEEGGSVNLGLARPSGTGTLTITVTTLPTIGQVFTAAGTPVVAGTVLTADELAGLVYRPPADYTAGTPVGTFGYSVSNGVDTVNGGTSIAVTPVNDAPLAIDASNSGGEDILLDVSLRGIDSDGTVASVTVRTLPANGTLLLRDTLAPVAVGALLTPAQSAALVFRPNANWNGSTSLTFTVTDNDGGVSAPSTVLLQITPANDPPLAVNDRTSTVAQAPVTVAVLSNDSDAENDPIAVSTASVSPALGSVVVNADGTLTFIAAPGVTGAVVISYTISDPSGATSSATLTVNVAATPTVTVDAPALTNDSTPPITGTSNLPPGSTVTLTVTDVNGAVQTFSTTVRPDGTYSVDVPAPLAEGPYTVVADVNGPGGTSATVNDNGVLDITPPLITVDAPALTNDSTPALTGTTDLPAGSTITLTVTGANGVSQLFTTTVQAGGVFSIDVPAALVSGPFSVSARGTDAAGNTATATDNGVVDTVPPAITVDAPALTNDTTPALTGTTDLPVGSTITLTVTGANGAAQTFTTTVQAGGVFGVNVPATLVEGNFSVSASGTDAAGNTATASDNGVIDITAPTVTVDAPALTNDTTPHLTGTTNLSAGSTVSIAVTGANGAVQTFNAAVQAGGTFSVDVPAALVQGNFSVTATATDAAGNGASASDTGLIDTTPPLASITIDPVTADNIVNAGEASGNITITGSVGGDVQVGNTVTINVNGVNYTGLVLAGNTFAISVPGSAVLADADRRIDGAVTTTDAAGNSATATAQRPYAVNTAPIAVNDALSVGEDTPSAGGDVTPSTPAQDRDADGDTLTVIGVATGVQPSASGNVNTPLTGTWGTLLLDGLGAYTYAPSAAAQALDPGQTVTDVFTYTISDGRGGSATATLTVSVVGANDPTTISGVFIGTVTEDAVATASGTLANNDPDVGTRAFVVQTNSAGTYGRFSIDAAGDWTYTLSNAAANVQALAQGQSVTETFIVATDDGTTASITVTVNGANDAPVVSSTSINAVEEGAPVALGLAVPSDIDNGAVLTITVSGLPAIGQVQLANGTAVANGAVLTSAQLAGLRYLPPTEYDGGAPVGTFAYSVSDGIVSVNGGTTINVAAVNDRPVAIDVSAGGVEDSGTRIAITLAGSDVDGTVVSYTLTSLPASGDLYTAASGGAPLAVGAVITGSVYFVPRADFNGNTSFGYTATDNSGAVSANTATATITITPVNDAPVLGGVASSVTFVEDGTTTVTPLVIDSNVLFSDIDSANLGGGSLTVAIGNVVAGQDVIDVRNQGTAAGQISIAGGNVLYNAGSGAVVIGTVSGGSSGSDLVISFNTSATPVAVDALIQNLRYTNTSQLPDTTPRNLTLTVVDGDGGTDSVSVGVTVNITSTNDAPTFTALGGTVSFSEGGAPVVLDNNATLNDVELGTGFNGSLNNLGGATLTLARGTGANTDDHFSGSGTLALSGGNVVLGGLTVGSYNTGALANGTLSITFANGTTTAQANSVLQQVTYENTSANPPPSLTVGYVFSDANSGAQGIGGALTASGSVTVNIAAFNNPPVAGNDNETTSENTPLNASVPAATDVDGTIASYALASGVGTGNGALVFNNNGTFTFNPGSDFDSLAVGATRNVTFTYTATDNGGAISAPATVTITVTGTNDGPVAFNASQTTGENSTLNANVPAASDVDGTISSYALVGNVGSGNGTLTFNSTGAYTFATGADFDTLAAGQTRQVTFTYTATDNSGAVSAPATVTITVTGANDAPTGADAIVTIAEDGSRAFAGADFGFADIDAGDTLAAVRINSLPAAGTLTLNGTPVTATQIIAAADLANLVFTPLANASGAPYAAFTVSVQDNGGLFDSAPNTITFNVTPVNDPPVAVVTPASGDEDTPIAVSLTGTDIDGTVTAVTVTALPGNGTLYLADGITPVTANTALSVAAAASLIFRPAADFNGTVNLTFTVTDNGGAVSAPAVLPITVAPVVDPAISIGDVTVNEGAGTVTFTVTLDQPTTATVSVNFATSNGTATAGADYTAGSGTLTFAPGATTRTITVPITDDGTYEGNETFNVVLSGAVNATIADATGIATITDNDTPTIAVSSPTVIEGGFAVFTVSLSNPSTTAVTFNPALSSGTATVGTDTATALEYFNGSAWVAVPVGGVILAAGSTSVQVRVATTDDFAAEGDETFALTATVTAGTTANASALGTATITDDIDPTTVSLSATASVAEGGSIVYTATLTNAAQTPVTVTLSSGETITIAAGATTGSVSILAPTDDVYVDAGSVSRTISSATGGNFESLVVNPAAASTAVTDTIDTTTVSITGDAVVAEGATASYTVSLTSAAQTAVTVNLTYSGTAANGVDYTGVATVTIPAGASSANFNIATLQDVLAEGSENFTVTIGSAAGGNFENLVISGTNGAATTSITDDDTPTIAVSSPTVTEGGFAVFTVSLSNPSTTAVVFNPALSSGTATVGTDTSTALEYFNGSSWVAVPVGGVTLAAGATSVQVRVATTDDFAAEGSETFALTATVTSGTTGNASATGTATITDDSDVTAVSLTATPSVAEGGSITYTATLDHAAVTPLTVTLSTGQTITIAAGATTGTVSILAPTDDPYIDASSVSRTIALTSGGGFESLSIDSTAATTAVTDTIDVTTATLTATPSVAEGGTITYTVSLTSPVSGSPVSVTLAGGQTITIAVGASSSTASVVSTDNVYAGGGSVTNSIASISGGNFEQLTPNTAPVTTTVTDDGDVTTVSLAATASVVEGTSITYTATLTNAAQTAVTVTLSNGATIAIAAGATSGTASVAAPRDDPYIDASTVNATIATATGGNFESLQIDPTAASTSVTDDVDPTTVSLSATASVAEGGSIVYTATLTNAAQTPVTVTLSSGETITIAAGATTGSVSILAPTEDVYVDAGSVSRTISSATGGNFELLTVDATAATTAVTDTIDTTTVSITGDAVVAEGATASYTISLTSAAQTAVTVNLNYSGTAADGSDFTGVATVTIPAGSSSANVNIATLQDALAEGVENFTVTIASAAGGNFENLAISGANGAQTTAIIDDDTPALSVSSPSTGEGGFAVFTVSLSNPSTTAVTFNPTLASGSATVGTDTDAALEYFNGASWVAVPVGGVTIAAGNTSVQVRVATIDDFAAEGSETFTLTATVTAGTTANASATGTATITDDVDATTVTLTATPSVAEGGNITYTATLDHAAVTPMTVTLSSGQTIGIAAGATTGTVSIAAPSDDPYIDAGSVSRTIASTSGGGLEAVTIDPAAATTVVTDTIDTTTATLTATPSVAEGGTITYTVSLTAPVTGSDVVVTLANGQTVTIAAGSSSASVTALAPDNVYGGGASVSNNIASISGGNFEQLAPNTAPVTTTVTDDADVTTVSLTATASVVEGGNITYTASLTNAAQTAVSVTLSNGATITIAAGATTGTALVVAPSDDPYIDASTVSATISTATGGNFESLQINPAAASTSVTDDIDPTAVSLSATASVAEGGNIVYVATLTNAAQTPVTVTLSSGETITIGAGATTGSVSIAAPSEDVYIDAGSVSRTITAASGGNFESLSVNPAAATTIVTDTINTTTVSITGDASVAEGATAAYTVSLTSPAQTAVTVNLSYSGTAANGSDFTGVATVTIPADSSSANFNIATLQDVLAEGSENFTVTIAGASGGNFESLVVSGANGAQTTQIIDDDTPSLSVSSPTVGEGGLAVFTVSLSNPSTSAVTFNPTLASGTATVGTDTATALEYFDGASWVAVPVGGVTLAAGSTSVQIRVATTDDFAAEGNETFALTATVTAGTTANASATGTATITDDTDATTVTLTATPSVAEGGSIIYTATLDHAAVMPMTVTLSNGATVAIAAGATSGTATVLAPSEDPYIDAGSVSATIGSTAGGGFEAVTINPAAAATTVTDTLDTTTLSIAGPASVTEGAGGVFTVSLTNPAQTAVTVNLSYSGTAANGSDYNGVATVTIAAGASGATFNIATIDDNIDEVAAESFTITVASASGGNFENLAISGSNGSVTTAIVDNDAAPTIAVSSPTVAEAGGFAVFTVSLSNPSSTATTVSLALADGTATAADYGPALQVSTDGGATWTAASSATFAAGATSVLVRTPVTNDALDEIDETFALSATRTAGTTSNASATGTATITDDDATPSVSIGNVSVNESAGTMTFTVTLSAASGQNVSVDYGTSNGTAAAGADYTAASGTLTFAAGVTSQTITVNVTEDTIFEGNETLAVTLSAPSNATIASGTGVGTILDNDAAPTLTVSSPTVVESGGFAVFTLGLSNPSSVATSFSLALANGSASAADYGPALQVSTDGGTTWTSATTATITAGATSVLARTPITNDALDENDETFTLTATTSAGTTGNPNASGTATITDDDATPSLAISDVSVNESAGTMSFTVTLSAASGLPVSVGYTTGNGSATAGADYTAASGTLTFATGVLSQTVTVTIAEDTIFEGNETLNVTLSGPTNASIADNLGVGTIIDNDAAPTLAVSNQSVAEGGGFAVFTLSLSNPSATATTVSLALANVSATGGGTDYGSATATNLQVSTDSGATWTNATSATFAAGATSVLVRTPVTNDALDEIDETFTLTATTSAGTTSNASASGTGTITDDDATPTLSISGPVSINEAAGTVTYTVTLSAPSGQSVSVNYGTANGSATAGADYTAASGTLSFAPGVTSQTFTVPIQNDGTYEGSESFTINLSAPSNATIATGTVTSNILDDGTGSGGTDNDLPSFTVSSPTVAESGGFAQFTVALSNATVSATTFNLALANITATGNGTDYGSAAATNLQVSTNGGATWTNATSATIAAGATSVLVRTPIANDALDEIDEIFSLTATRTAGTTSNASALGTATITDDDATPSLSINNVSVNESAGTMTFTVTLSAASGQAVGVNYGTSNGTATAGADYTAGSGTLAFAPGVTSQTVTVNISEDTIFEGNETLNVTLSAPTNATLGIATGIGTIIDNDAAPTLTVSSPTVAESGGFAVFTLGLSNPSSTATSFNLALANGTATAADYGPALEVSTDGGTIWTSATSATLAAGTTSALVRTPITNDALDEADETFTLTATRTAGSTANASAIGTATITDDDATPSLAINDVTVNEAAGTMTFTVTLSAASGQNVSVNYASSNGTATAGADYTAGSGTLSFAPGLTSQTVTVNITEDTIFEGSETLNVTLSSPVNATIADNLGVGTITDNDAAPTLAVSSQSVVEAGGFAVFTLSLSNPSATATTVSLALANGTATGGGTDYGSATATNLQVSSDGGATWTNSTSATFAAGATSVLVRTPVANDTLDEIDETFTLTATTSAGTTSNASAAGTTTITDDDATPTLAINDVTVNEAASTITFTVTLSAASGQNVSVNYATSNGTATAGADYTAGSGTLTFAPGVTSQTVTVTIAEDTIFEGNETLNVTLSAPTNATIADNFGVGTITDNDAAPTLTISSPTVAEAGGFAIFTLGLSNPSSTATSVNLALANITASGAGTDYGSATATNLQVSTDGGTTWTNATSATFAAGATSVLVRTPITNDALDEVNETFSLTATTSAGTTSNASAIGTATITDDDPTPSLSISGPVSINEAAGTVTYTVTLSAPSGQSVSVNYGTTAGTATAGTDYTTTSGTLTFAPGVTSQTFTVPIVNDSTYEGSESFTINLSTPTNATIATGTVTSNILDDGTGSGGTDNDTPSLSVSSPTVGEAGGFAQFTLSLSNPSSTATTVSLALANITATGGGTDYGSATATNLQVSTDGGTTWTNATSATFAAGATSVLVRTPIVNDALDEIDETFSLTATRTAGTTANASAIGTATVTDDDATPSLAINDVTVNEAAGTMTFTVTLSAASGQSVGVNYATSNGTATAGADYTAGSGTLTFAPGVTSQTVTVTISEDTIFEGNETLNVTLSSATNATIADTLGIGTITDNDLAPTLTVSSPTVAENGGFAVFTLGLSNPSATATSFSLALANGTAGAADYTTALQVSTDGGTTWTTATTATIAAGATSVLVRTPVTDDTIDENDETFSLTATRTAGSTSNASASGTATITDNDATPSLSIGNVSVNESAGTMTFTVTLSAASGLPVSVGYATSNGTATAGADYTAGSGTLNFAAGVTSQTVTVTIAEDTIFEGSETLNVTLSAPTNATLDTATGVGTIVDNDAAPTLAVSSLTVAEAGGFAQFTLSLSNPSSTATTVNLALANGTATGGGTDYGSATATNLQISTDGGTTWTNATSATFAAGATSVLVRTPITNDALDEASETFTLTATTSAGTTSNPSATGTATITDDDPTPSLAINDVTVNESAGTMTFTVSLSAASGQSVSVNYGSSNGTAVAGSDYTAASGTLTFAPGVTSQTITVPILGDTVYEPGETLYVNLSAPSNATIADGLGIGTIVDDDAKPTVSTVSAATVTEGVSLVHTVTLSNASSTATTLAYTLGGGTATAVVDYSVTPTFSNGVTLSGGVLTVPAGVSSFTVTVASVADTINEPNETYNLAVGGVTAVGTINNDDATPSLNVNNITVNETAGFAVFSVGLGNPSSSAVSVNLLFADGTATGGTGGTGSATDYGNLTRMQVSTDGGATWSATGTNTATIAAGQTSVLVRTTIINNTGGTELPSETFTLTATNAAATTSNPTATGTATIIEQDIAISSATITEGTGAGTTTGTLTVTINPAFGAATSLPFTLSGTALSPADYGTLTFSNGVMASGGNITIPSGVTSFTISVPVVQDALDESNETVLVNIAGSNGTLTITDDDATPTLAINDVTVNEGAGTATFTVTLSAASGQTVTVNYGMVNQTALSGVDFTASAGTLTFAPGTTTQTITVPILQDNVYEGTETFRINLTTPVNATIADGVGIGTIADNGTGIGGTDNDTPTLAVSSITVSDQSNGFATFVVSLSNPSATATSVNLALANGTATGGGVDYGAAGATNLQVSTDNGATWVNATSATIAISSSYVLVRTPIIGDVANEVSETFTLTATRTAGTTTNASASGLGTITDIYNGPDAINDAPSAMLQEDTPAQTVLAGNVIQGGAGNVADTDPNNDTLAVTGAAAGNSLVTGLVALGSPLTVSGIYGNLVIQADGTYTYTLDNARIQTQNMIGGQVYNDVFSYRVTDGNGGYDTATITISATGTLDLTAITPQPVAVAADGLQGEYYGYNDTTIAGNRVHADDGTATSLGTGTNLESVEDITAIINGRNALMGGPNNIVGTNLAGATNAADVIFNVRTLNYGTTPVVSSDLGDNAAVAAGNALPPQDNISGSGTTTALANFLDQDSSTARAQTGTPTGATVGTQTGLGTTTDAMIRMSGLVYLERGNYDFRVTADDGFRLRVGGETLLEFDGNQPPTTRTYFNVEVNDRISGLTSIELLYWEQGGNANLQFEFKPSDSATWVPFSLDSLAFFSAATAPTLTDTRIQDIVETSVNQQYELRTGSVLDGDGNINTLTGAEGRDYIQGFGGDDILNGNGSADYLDGGIGNDVLNGGDGNDILVGGTGNDVMTGGLGDDIYRVDSAGDVVNELAGAGQGTDTVEIEASYNVGTYVIGANIENALLLGSFNSNVTGNTANNRITGNDGNNILIGGAGDDRILGGRGNDTLSGDAGPLAGGNVGKDIFEWNLADRGTGGAPAIDRITDFTYSGSTTSSAVPSGDLTPQHTDSLDLRDLLVGESSTSLNTGATPNIGNLLNYIDISVVGGETSIRISSTGGFAGGTYAAGQEDQRIVLTGVDLYGITGTTTETELLQRLLANGTLVVD